MRTGRSSVPRTRGEPRRRRALGVALVAVLSATGLAACSSDSGPPELIWYTNPDAGGQDKIAADCTKAANGRYTITTSLLPRDAASQREQLVRRLAANDDSIDLMSLDPPFIAEFAEAGFLAPVPDDVAQATTEDVVQAAITNSTWRDKLVAVPMWANTQLLWFRKSVAEQAGLDMTKPVTWQQLIDAAEQQQTDIAVQGIRAESLTVWINALVESAGGHILENPEAPADEVKLGLETDAGRSAASIIQEIADKGLGGPALSTENEDASRALFESGDASFMVNWPFVWPAANEGAKAGTLDQAIVDDYGWAQYPAVDDGQESRPPFGGISLAVGAFSKHTDLAYDAIQCIVKPENQAYYFVSNGNPAVKRSVFSDAEVLASFPMAGAIATSLDNAAPRPQTPYYNEVSQGLQNTWHPPSAVDPDTSPEEATELITGVLRKERLL
jgi:multiple sugar transport system substrate-binding protein